MIKIKYNDSSNMLGVTFIKNSDHFVTLKGPVYTNTSGFTTWRMDGKTQLGNFSDFVTVYRVLEDGVQYSNDGSVYVEPELVEEIPTVEIPINNEPSQLDRIEAQIMYTAIMTNTLMPEEEIIEEVEEEIVNDDSESAE